MNLETTQVIRSFIAPVSDLSYYESHITHMQQPKSIENITSNTARRALIELNVDRNPRFSWKEKTVLILKTLISNIGSILETTIGVICLIASIAIFAIGIYYMFAYLPVYLSGLYWEDMISAFLTLIFLWTVLFIAAASLSLNLTIQSSTYLHEKMQAALNSATITIAQKNYTQNIDRFDLLNPENPEGALLDPISKEPINLEQINTSRYIKIGHYLFKTPTLMQHLFLNDLSSDQIKHPVEDRYFTVNEQQELFLHLKALSGASELLILDSFNPFDIGNFYNPNTKAEYEKQRYALHLSRTNPEYNRLTTAQQNAYILANKQRDFCTLRLAKFMRSLNPSVAPHFQRLITPA